MEIRETILKSLIKRYIRPLFISAIRLPIRYAPYQRIRTVFWELFVMRFFEHSDHAFVAATVFGAKVSGSTKDKIQRYIFYFGKWEPNLTEFMGERLAAGDVFVDVGANV